MIEGWNDGIGDSAERQRCCARRRSGGIGSVGNTWDVRQDKSQRGAEIIWDEFRPKLPKYAQFKEFFSVLYRTLPRRQKSIDHKTDRGSKAEGGSVQIEQT
eukprot:EG_transcript_39603